MGSKRRKEVPIILNYTGEIIKVVLPENDERFKCQTGNTLLLPPLGYPKIEIIRTKEEGAIFHSETHIVHGLPPPMKGILYVVQDNIAKMLFGTRSDLLIIYNKREENTENILKPEEIMLVGDDFAYFFITTEEN